MAANTLPTALLEVDGETLHDITGHNCTANKSYQCGNPVFSRLTSSLLSLKKGFWDFPPKNQSTVLSFSFGSERDGLGLFMPPRLYCGHRLLTQPHIELLLCC